MLTSAEIHDLLETFNRGPIGVRNRALLLVMYRAGLRVGELLALRPADVDLEEGAINVRRGKGDRQRVVGIDDGALRVIKRWISHRSRLGISAAATLFCQRDGSVLQPTAVRQLLKRAADHAGIQKRVHPHGLRHTYAAELAREGFPVNAIQRSLGHANLSVTSEYLDHLAPADVIAVGRSRTWPSGEGGAGSEGRRVEGGAAGFRSAGGMVAGRAGDLPSALVSPQPIGWVLGVHEGMIVLGIAPAQLARNGLAPGGADSR